MSVRVDVRLDTAASEPLWAGTMALSRVPCLNEYLKVNDDVYRVDRVVLYSLVAGGSPNEAHVKAYKVSDFIY